MLDFHIIITTYNRHSSCLDLIKSIQSQLIGKEYSIHIFDDHSSQPLDINEDSHIKYFRFDRNLGRNWYWWAVDYAFKQILESKYYIMLPDDVRLSEDFFVNASAQWESIKDQRKATLELMINKEREGRSCWTFYKPRREQHGEYFFWHNQWSDLCFIANKFLFDTALKNVINPVPLNRWDNNGLLSSGVGEQISIRLNNGGYNMYSVVNSLCSHLDTPSKMNPYVRKIMPMRSVIEDEKISVCIASISTREKVIVGTINSLINQVDKIYLYLNNYSTESALKIKNINPAKIEYAIGDNKLGDAGKFFFSEKLTGYILTADDDIIYPSEYVKEIIAGIEKYNRKAIVTFHGRIFLEIPAKSYYKYNKLFSCLGTVVSDSQIHVGGTGVMAWHSTAIKTSLNDFPSANMADVHFSILANKYNVPIMILAHKGDWIKSVAAPDSIYSKMVYNDAEQTKRINEVKWNLNQIFSRPAYVISLSYRTDRRNSMVDQYYKHGLRLIMIDAVDGKVVFQNESIKRKGFLGCYTSHLNLLKNLKDKDDSSFIILEDDCVFCENFYSRLSECMKELPNDWDLLYLGGSLVRDKATEDYSTNLKKATDVLCTHAYIVNKKSVQGLIEHVEKRAHKIDVIYCEYQKTHNCFLAYPELSWQMAGYSDVMFRETNNTHLKYGKN